MKSSENFKRVIQNYLEELVRRDELFAASYRKENKNMDDCIKYMLNTIRKSGINGFEDDEVFAMAVHYYDEDTIDVGGDVNCQVVVNHTVQLTEEEKTKAKEEAIQQEIAAQRQKMRKKPQKVEKTETATVQTLF